MLYSSIPAPAREIASVVHFADRWQITGQLRAAMERMTGFSAEAMPGSDADSAQDALDRAFAEKIGCAPVLPL